MEAYTFGVLLLDSGETCQIVRVSFESIKEPLCNVVAEGTEGCVPRDRSYIWGTVLC